MLELRAARLDEPDAVLLIREVQAYYVEIYGGEDDDPLDPAEFAPPAGGFLIGADEGSPVAMGGWTAMRDQPGDAQIRRMFVRAPARRHGYAGVLLDALEADAAAHGMRRSVLTTGTPQVEAIPFYRSRGYVDIPAFGFYAAYDGAVHLGKAIGPV